MGFRFVFLDLSLSLKTDLSRNKWEKTDQNDAHDQMKPASIQDPTNNDPGYPRVWKKLFLSFQISWILKPKVQTECDII